MTDLARRPVNGAEPFNADQIELLRKTVAKDGSAEEFALFLEACRRTGLSPIARQIYLLKSGEGRVTIQVSIDGFRLIAERTGHYAGQLGPQWCGEDGAWRDVWLAEGPPAAARVAVLRHDWREPLWAVARWRSYARQNSPTWKTMPDLMLAKVAEALALRRAFPQELSGLYTRDEMAQAAPLDETEVETIPDARPLVAPLEPVTDTLPADDVDELADKRAEATDLYAQCTAAGMRVGPPHPAATGMALDEYIGKHRRMLTARR
jgi:phage recombination protein Bet